MTSRFFLFADDGSMRRMSQRKVAVGSLLPEYANRKMRYAMVYLDTRDGKPVAIRKIEAGYMEFDGTGNSQPSLAQSAMTKWETWEDAEREKELAGQVIPITGRRAHDRAMRESRWTPNQSELKQIEAAIWPRGRPTR
jgi:hypothetical protein